jgi:hypothetical protein
MVTKGRLNDLLDRSAALGLGAGGVQKGRPRSRRPSDVGHASTGRLTLVAPDTVV